MSYVCHVFVDAYVCGCAGCHSDRDATVRSKALTVLREQVPVLWQHQLGAGAEQQGPGTAACSGIISDVVVSVLRTR